MRHSTNITTNADTFLCRAIKPRNREEWAAHLEVGGTFDSATVTLKASNDGGNSFYNLLDSAGNAFAVSSASSTNVRLPVGARKLGENLDIYATTSGGSSSIDIDIVLEDNR